MSMTKISSLSELSERELLVELNKAQRQSSARQMIASVAVLVIAVLLLIATLLVVPKAIRLMNELTDTLTGMNTLIEEGQSAVTQINGLIGDVEGAMGKVDVVLDDLQPAVEKLEGTVTGIDTMVNGINGMVEQNSQNLASAIEKMNSIDFETLNKAIAELEQTVEPFAKFFGAFSQ
ncbi:MAG: hypothetical protein J6P72_07500 [Firmicutes bacterium]|nr:hypothetical protein [Bacillota bacterium]